MYHDPSDELFDFFVDLFFIVVDVVAVIIDPSVENQNALVADVGCALIPFATGGGLVVRGASAANKAIDAYNTFDNAVDTYNAVDNIGDTAKAVDNGFDSFRSLKKAYGTVGNGNQLHHIVEQCQIIKSKFGIRQIQNLDNIIEINSSTHRAISAYYSSIDEYLDSTKRVRDWLAGQTLEFQKQFGLEGLKKYGVG